MREGRDKDEEAVRGRDDPFLPEGREGRAPLSNRAVSAPLPSPLGWKCSSTPRVVSRGAGRDPCRNSKATV